MLWTFFAAQSWALWTTRNKFTIEKKFPQQPANCIFKCLLNLQLAPTPKDLRICGWWSWRRWPRTSSSAPTMRSSLHVRS
jgi:hypothetical protein